MDDLNKSGQLAAAMRILSSLFGFSKATLERTEVHAETREISEGLSCASSEASGSVVPNTIKCLTSLDDYM